MITTADLPQADLHAEALGQAAYEAWALSQTRPAPWGSLTDAAQFVWLRVALAAIGGALEFSGAVDAPAASPFQAGLQ